MSYAKNWCFTLNNYTDEELDKINGAFRDGGILYLIYGREVGAEGTPHLQGYVQFEGRKRLPQVKRVLGDRCHLEVARGTPQRNIEYCSKEGEQTEFGEAQTNAGRSSRFQEAIDRMQGGGTIHDLWSEYPDQMIRYRGGFTAYARHLFTVETTLYPLESFRWNFDMNFEKSIVFWGDSGIGKTCFALALLPGALLVSHIDQLLDFDPQRHTGIVFDDMDFRHVPRTAQIHLLDNDQFRAIHCRYDCARIPAKTKKIFTTNEINGEIFLDDPAINRRRRIIHLI